MSEEIVFLVIAAEYTEDIPEIGRRHGQSAVHCLTAHLLALDAAVNAKGYHPAGITDQAACIGCASCALMCPDCCISIYELEEGETA